MAEFPANSPDILSLRKFLQMTLKSTSSTTWMNRTIYYLRKDQFLVCVLACLANNAILFKQSPRISICKIGIVPCILVLHNLYFSIAVDDLAKDYHDEYKTISSERINFSDPVFMDVSAELPAERLVKAHGNQIHRITPYFFSNHQLTK